MPRQYKCVCMGTKIQLACVAGVGCQSERPLRLLCYHSSTTPVSVVESREVVLILVVKVYFMSSSINLVFSRCTSKRVRGPVYACIECLHNSLMGYTMSF